MTTKAVFIVRAEVPEADRAAFDRWYETEHLDEAEEAFGAIRAWRGWSKVDPAVHMAFYEFDSLAKAEAVPGSEALKILVGKFDAEWQGRVTRARELIEIV